MVFEKLLWRVACPNYASFRLFDIRQKRFPWTHKEVDLVLHPVDGLVLEVGDAEKFPHAPGFEILDPFFSQPAGFMLCFATIEEGGDDERLVELELACEADGGARLDPV